MTSSLQMMRDFNLPKIPGNGLSDELLRTNFRKPQLLNMTSGVADRPPAVMQEHDTFKLANTQLGNTNPYGQTTGSYSATTSRKIALDRKVLRFQCFFKEGVHESALEQERLRKCLIYYFLEDDTISVSEPKQDNAGIPGQGALINRHQIPQPDGSAYSFEMFNIGTNVTFYGKTFHIIDCDTFTRRFLEQLGIHVPEPEGWPDDAYTVSRKGTYGRAGAKKPKDDEMEYMGMQGRRTKLSPAEIAGTKQFLANDKKVLRFYCRWDDRPSLYGDVRLFTIQYFLADDTMEISETNPPNSGRDPFPSFVKRQKVPKPKAGKFINPNASLSFKKEAAEYYTDRDLLIGEYLNVYGRVFLIYDCDSWTKEFLGAKYGIVDFAPIDISQPGPPKVQTEPPPYNGFGDEEDSLGSWKYLVTKPPKKDVKKFLENSNKVLKFQLRLIGGDTSNAVRRFVLTYFLADDTLSIFEPAQRNSGIIGGKFLNRQKVKKMSPEGVPTGEYITPSDLFVGAKTTINTHQFQIYGTDERSLNHMEEDPGTFQMSNINAILTKLRALVLSRGLRNAFADADKDGSGVLDFREFASIVEAFHLPLCEQEILTIMRHFDKNGDGSISWQEFMGVIADPQFEEQYERVKERDWEEIRQMAERANEDQVDKFRTQMAGSIQRVNQVQDVACRAFLEKYNQQRALIHRTLHIASDNSPDGLIGESEFRKVVKSKIEFPENQLKAVCAKLFPPTVKRIAVTELIKILNHTSTHTHFMGR
eukprot:TRINITY_DN67834_c7_g14_i1.p1 TRINITY_DN67834_c7_g14~~TRINITY_DN67834_c7_g14_i1.p1  ORF type:complete len:759 (-),score=100.08 TRINITY_DN67834_c7_g14_i1:1110-3386(-)